MPLLFLVAVEVIPTLAVVWTSFTHYNPLVPDSLYSFVGLNNYERLVSDPLVWQALRNTFYFAIIYMPIAIVGGLVAADMLNQRIRGRAVFRGIFFMPVIVSWVVGATIIMWFLDPAAGLVGIVFHRLGLGPLPQLLQEASTAMPAVAFVGIWKYFGYNTVIFLAGLQAIDPSLNESAQVDGASPFQRFRYVTVPMMRRIMAVVIAINLIQAMRIFDPMMIMTNGGPNFSTTSVVLYVYRMAYDNLQFGYGSAITLLLLLIVFVIGGAQFWLLNRGSVEA